METKTETQEKRKPHRILTPELVRLLTNVGLTNLDEEAVREYRVSYESCYGNLNSTMLSVLHKIGMINLTDEQVDSYCEMGRK